MKQHTEDLAREFLEEFFRLGRYAPSRKVSHSMRGEAFLLLYLWKKQDSATAGELGSAMKISSARVAAALNNLERKGQIVRRTDAKDRRKTLVELTAEGERQAREWQQMPLHMITQLMERLGEEDAQQMVYLLKRINEIMPQMEHCENVCKDLEGKDNRDYS